MLDAIMVEFGDLAASAHSTVQGTACRKNAKFRHLGRRPERFPICTQSCGCIFGDEPGRSRFSRGLPVGFWDRPVRAGLSDDQIRPASGWGLSVCRLPGLQGGRSQGEDRTLRRIRLPVKSEQRPTYLQTKRVTASDKRGSKLASRYSDDRRKVDEIAKSGRAPSNTGPGSQGDALEGGQVLLSYTIPVFKKHSEREVRHENSHRGSEEDEAVRCYGCPLVRS